MKADAFSQWLGIEVLDVSFGYCKIKMQVREQMVNGFRTAHGGIAFSFADSAFAFACNSDGYINVALDVSTSFTKPVVVGDVLTAEAKQLVKTNKTGVYTVEVTNASGDLVCFFKGTCYRTEKRLIDVSAK